MLTERQVVAFALGHQGLDPRRVSATLARERWGGIVVSPNGVWRILGARRATNGRASRARRASGLPVLVSEIGGANMRRRATLR